MKFKRNIFHTLVYLIPILLFTNAYAQKPSLKKELSSTKATMNLYDEYIGGFINKSGIKLGFLNNGRFAAPGDWIPELPSAEFEGSGYLGMLDLWIGIPDGPWAPKVWDADSNKYVSLGPTVSGTVFEPYTSGTDWSTISASRGVFYTNALTYNDIYKKTDVFDFLLTPTSEYEDSWPRDPLTGFKTWPGRWKKDSFSPITGRGDFFSDQDIFMAFDDKSLADIYYPAEDYYDYRGRQFPSQRGYSIGAEVFVQTASFQSAVIGNMIIFDLQIINTSNWNYHDVYLGLYYGADVPWYWSTPYRYYYPGLKNSYIKNEFSEELGEVFPYNLSYAYNKKDYNQAQYPRVDSSYFGLQFLKTPLAENDGKDNDGDGVIDEPEGEELGLTGWHFFYPSYLIYTQFKREQFQYQLLSGDTTGLENWMDRVCFFKEASGETDPNFDPPERIRQYYSSPYYSPTRGEVWYAFDAMSCGPINWAAGDTLHFVFGIILSESEEKLKKSARIARKIVHNDYHQQEGPPPPKVTAVPGDGKITLYWDDEAESAENFITGYHNFEGYKIYRTTSDPQNYDWGEAILDHDGNLVNFIPVASCDLDNGINGYETVYPFQKLGDDTGLFHTWVDTNVTNGVAYWYSVCAYDHGIVESTYLNPMQYPVSALAECPKGTNPELFSNLVRVIPGLVASDYSSTSLEVTRASESSGNGPIEAVILDPFAITGHEYAINFEDTTFGFAVYDLYDLTEEKSIYEKVTQTNGEEGIIFDGIQLKITRYDELEILNAVTYWYNYLDSSSSDCTWEIFGDKLTWDPYPFNYEIRFIDSLETGAFTGKTAPFQIWNTALDHKCDWDIFFDAKTDTTDSMRATWTSNDMIYIRDNFFGKDKFTIRVHIVEYSYVTITGRVNNPPQAGDAIHFEFKRPFQTGDQFIIHTAGLAPKANRQNVLDNIKVVPNPFIVHAGWELSSGEARIQFINLPSECTIHIFSMAGEQVRTLYHNDVIDYEFWDLLNNSNLKVSFGLYIYIVETPDGKATKGKFAILR